MTVFAVLYSAECIPTAGQYISTGALETCPITYVYYVYFTAEERNSEISYNVYSYDAGETGCEHESKPSPIFHII